MPQPYTLLIDDQDSEINYLCPSLHQQVLAGASFNNTWSTITDSACRKGWFEYTFYGTGIHIHVPTTELADSAAVLLDNELFKPNGEGIFEAQNLTDGKHTFKYGIGEVSSQPDFDYLTVTAGPSTPLVGKTLIVDDADASLNYRGSWATTSPQPLLFDYSTDLYRGTTHWSTTVGDMIEFQFTGSSVAVYGIASNITSGNITLSYMIDGVTTTRGVPEGVLDSLPMTRFFHSDLQPGPHTLIINVTEIAAPRAFGIDFITYNSSVANVSALPGYTATGNAGAPSPDSGPSSGGATAKYAILGGVLGGVGFLLALGLVLLIWKRRYQTHAVRLASNNNSSDDVAATAQQPPMTQSAP